MADGPLALAADSEVSGVAGPNEPKNASGDVTHSSTHAITQKSASVEWAGICEGRGIFGKTGG